MRRGFTLIELIISMLLLVSLTALAIPSFVTFQRNTEVKRLASDLLGFLTEVKTQSIMLNEPLELSFQQADGNVNNEGWSFSLYQQEDTSQSMLKGSGFNYSYGNEKRRISYFNGNEFPNIHIEWNRDNIIYQGVNGKPVRAFTIQFYVDESKPLKAIVHNVTGRVRVCSVGGNYYGYQRC